MTFLNVTLVCLPPTLKTITFQLILTLKQSGTLIQEAANARYSPENHDIFRSAHFTDTEKMSQREQVHEECLKKNGTEGRMGVKSQPPRTGPSFALCVGVTSRTHSAGSFRRSLLIKDNLSLKQH